MPISRTNDLYTVYSAVAAYNLVLVPDVAFASAHNRRLDHPPLCHDSATPPCRPPRTHTGPNCRPRWATGHPGSIKPSATAREETGFVAIELPVTVHIPVGPEKEPSDPHTHPYEQLNMLVEGRLDFLVDGERVELEPYDTLVIPPEQFQRNVIKLPGSAVNP